MLVYNDTKRQFVSDVRCGFIEDKIKECIRQKGLNAGQDKEYESWHNSMQFMRNIIDDQEIDDNVRVAIEYNIPLTPKRVDFIISGADQKGNDNVVIVELKQWQEADIVNYAVLIADKYDLDIKQIVLDKLRQNAKKYPVEKAYGSSKKYNEL